MESLSSDCQTAYKASSSCFSTAVDANASADSSALCGKCGDLTEVLFASCNSTDLQNKSVWTAAMQCHKENGEYCVKGKDTKIDVVKCSNQCSQFVAKVNPSIFNSSDLHGQEKLIQDCADKYPNDLPNGNSTTSGDSNNSTATSSASSTSFTMLTLSTLMLI
eukprot:NODE_143_length_15882_cov_1.296585.p10 type:complete len:163 gc:universal NODE_143_length_15882_cov_1.296585:9951-9463(-)